MLQLDVSLLKALTERGVTFIALETNGTLPISPSIKKFLDWITVSPKTGLNNLAIKRGDELKVVFPECASTDLIMAVDTELRFSHYLIQPCYGPALTAYTEQAVEFVLKYPRWRISTQMQRIWRIR